MRYRITVDGLEQYASHKYAAKVIATALNLTTGRTARIYEDGALIAVVNTQKGCWEVVG